MASAANNILAHDSLARWTFIGEVPEVHISQHRCNYRGQPHDACRATHRKRRGRGKFSVRLRRDCRELASPLIALDSLSWLHGETLSALRPLLVISSLRHVPLLDFVERLRTDRTKTCGPLCPPSAHHHRSSNNRRHLCKPFDVPITLPIPLPYPPPGTVPGPPGGSPLPTSSHSSPPTQAARCTRSWPSTGWTPTC
jgi:hypothetical protein